MLQAGRVDLNRNKVIVKRSLLYCLALVLAITDWSCVAHAEENDASLHILRFLIHADRDEAEACFEVDHILDLGSHPRVVTALQLESEGKIQALAPQNIVLDTNNLCVIGLDHRRDYNIKIPFLRGAKGEKLSDPYTISFRVPDRHATLDFMGNTSGNGLIMWHHEDPVLRAVNIDHVHVDLYQITDLAALGEAWRQRLQTTLAPSESVYFAKHNGMVVGQQDIELATHPNAKIEQPVILSKLQPQDSFGLYLLVASAPQAEAKTKKLSLAPLAATWLLRSNLDLQVIPTNNGFYILTEQNNRSSVAQGVRVVFQDNNGKVWAETKSDSNGVSFLSYPEKDHPDTGTVIGLTQHGDIAFADLIPTSQGAFVAPTSDASLVTDKAFYQPQDTVNITLTARDMRGQPLTLKDTNLRVLRADQSLFTVLPVPATEGGHVHMALPAPSSDGLWSLSWVKSDGTPLAEGALRLTMNTEAPHFDITADRSMVPDDGMFNLTVKSLTYKGVAAPYLAGHTAVTWIVPDKIFPEFSEYSFGVHDHIASPSLPLASFVTDSKGIAHLHIKLGVPPRGLPVEAAYLNVASDAATGALPAVPVVIPVRPKDFIIGIKAEAQNNHFPENSLAHFELIALDSNGKRRAISDLSYQISEEGRHFDWYPLDGHWDYKPLRQDRRLGGAPLTLSAQDANIIEWPVSAGTYRLDIMNADGITLARLPFSAGWGALPSDREKSGVLSLSFPKDGLHVGQNNLIHFNLPQSAVITAVVADDRVRQVVHGLKAKGENTLEIIPQQDWGKRLSVSIDAAGINFSGRALLTPSSGREDEAGTLKVGQSIALASQPLMADMPLLLRHNDVVKTVVTVTNTTTNTETYHYSFAVSTGIQLANSQQGDVVILAGQQKDIPLELKMTRTGTQFVHLDISGSHGFHANRNWPITVDEGVLPLLVSGQSQVLGPQQSQTLAANDKKQKFQHANIIVGQVIPERLPEILSTFVHADPFTSRDIALWLEGFELWHQIITQTDLLSEEAFVLRRQNVLRQLLTRQADDGGFPLVPQQKSDLGSTIAALYTLASLDTPSAQVALEQASGWLHRYLENSWFDEGERPLRAAAYAALAKVNRLDVSSLYYFSDNCKTLPALAAVQLAQAFMAINDRPKAHYWLQSISLDNKDQKNLPLLAALAFDPLTSVPDYSTLLDKTKGSFANNSVQSMEDMTSFLKAVVGLNNKDGAWRALINGVDKSYKGLQVLSFSDKPISIHNMTEQPLMLQSASDIITKSSSGIIARHLYLPNGIDITSNPVFDTHGVYVMVLEGAWPKESTESFVISDDSSAELYPASCALNDGTQTDESLAWIKQQPLNPVTLCEATAHGVRVVLDPSTRGETNWRIAYLVKAEWSGSFGFTQAHIVP